MLTLTTALPEMLPTVTLGPDRLVVPPEIAAKGIVLALSKVTSPPETPSDVVPTVAPEPTVTPAKLLPATFRAGTLPAVTLTTVLLPETVATVTLGPARLVVPPESVATGTVLVLSRVTSPPETPSEVLPTVAPEPAITPPTRLLPATFSVGTLPAVTLTTVLLPETAATATVGPTRLVVPPESVAMGIVLVLSRVTSPPETPSDVRAHQGAGAHGHAVGQVAAEDVQGGGSTGADGDDGGAEDVDGTIYGPAAREDT